MKKLAYLTFVGGIILLIIVFIQIALLIWSPYNAIEPTSLLSMILNFVILPVTSIIYISRGFEEILKIKRNK